jgi:hypothetical protein
MVSRRARCVKQKPSLLRGFAYGGDFKPNLEPLTKGLVKKRMTVDDYLAHEPEVEKPYSEQVSSLLDSEAEVWNRVWWRLLNEQFLGWYIWLKDNLAAVKEWVEEIKGANETIFVENK